MAESFGIFEDCFDGNVMLLYYQYLRWVILLPVITSKFRRKMKADKYRWYRSSLPIYLLEHWLFIPPGKKAVFSSTSYSCIGLQCVLYKLIIMFLQISCIS